MPHTSTSKPGKSTPLNMSERDITITVTAVLKSVIETGAHPEDWWTRTAYGLRVHRNLCKRLQGIRESKPQWEGEEDNGNQDPG